MEQHELDKPLTEIELSQLYEIIRIGLIKTKATRKNQSWQDAANCLDSDPNMFYPSRGRNKGQHGKAICEACEVQLECLEYALNQNEEFGIWGGETVEDRKSIKRQRKKVRQQEKPAA